MGFLLKEVLKNLCAANQWCYAVFWKIGCQNPNLLIWEECHYEPMSLSIPRSGLPFGEWEGCWAPPKVQSSQVGTLTGDRVQTLINKMMMDNQVNVVGEGIVGRSAFTGKHQWILSNNYIRHPHSPEVSNEVQNQFSAGMQTVVVVPVLPHGVVQLGSPLAIPENMGFVNDVKSLILQLGCVPGALLFDHYPTKVSTEEIGLPETFGMPVSVNSAGIYEVINSTSMPGTSNQQSNLPQASAPVGQSLYPLMQQVQGNALTSSSTFLTPKLVHTSSKSQASRCQSVDISAMNRPNLPFRGQLHNSVVGADVIPSNLDAWSNQEPSGNSGLISSHQPTNGQLGTSHSSLRVIEQNFSEAGLQGQGIADFIASQLRTNGCEIQKGVPNPQKSTNMNLCGGHVAGFEFRNVESSSKEVAVLPDAKHMPIVPNEHIHGLNRDCEKHESSSRSAILKYEDAAASVKPSSGDDLFDMLGLDYKNKILNGNSNGLIANELDTTPQSTFKDTSIFMNMHDPGSEIYSTNDEISDSGLFSGMGMGTDHLLDAVVSRAQSFVKQSLDDNVSCGTTVTKISSSSIPNTPPTYGRGNRSDQAFSLPSSLLKPGGVGSSSFKSGYGKDDPGSCSQTSSIYGSQISSWAEQGHNVKHDTSVSTGFSKKPDDTSKPNRKRLKPGENPRPRPKDRQMIQDRVKELREIVPNGAKCSIDALLERTIKHMLFLQSVTKHADKLKHTGESKIVNKEGGLVLKDNFEGGATWAFEVGSQSMVCPIIVEDLSSPRQMLVEMLCEERGFFLEIADLIRGMGLTILKGVMEARNDQIWARFAVEANRDVTRMEIFMSLVRLLEQTIKGSASSGNSMDNNNMIIHHSFPQAASIPATGSMQ